jgi:acetylornithine deacetylase/succinyl-diaminopimelate desuccinylase-like protein
MINKIDEKFLKDLKEYISFKSISTDEAYLGEIEKTVFWLKSYIENAGGKVELLQKGKSNPVVLGNFFVEEKLPTVLLYGHYDVQPAAKEDGWTTGDPFILEQKNLGKKDRLVARGVVDNKGQNFIHLYTICKLFQKGKLRYNVKTFIEGGEECGSPDLDLILQTYGKSHLQADYLLVSDGEIVKDNPVLESSLRGVGNMKVTLTTGKNNLHSGLFGGAVPSATDEMSKLISSFKDGRNRVLVKDFYKGVTLPNKEVLKNNKNLGTEKEATKTAGVKKLLTIKNYDFYTQTGCLPSLEISGVKGGYIGEGFSNIVPATSECRINVRVVPKQKTQDVMRLIQNHVKKVVPKYVEVKVEMEGHGDSIKLDSGCEFAKEVRKILEKSYRKKVLDKYLGGSIPVLGDFQKLLKIKVVSASLGNNDCNMHGVDENFRVDLVEKGLSFAENFWAK